MPRSGTTEQYAKYFSNQYFRPGKPHMSRRLELTKDLPNNIGTPLTFEQQTTNTLNNRYPDLMMDVDVNQEPRKRQIRKKENSNPLSIFGSNTSNPLSISNVKKTGANTLRILTNPFGL